MSQTKIVQQKLREEGVVSNLWAIENRIWRLGALIFNLRRDGWTIETKMIGKVAHYKLKETPEQKVQEIKNEIAYNKYDRETWQKLPL